MCRVFLACNCHRKVYVLASSNVQNTDTAFLLTKQCILISTSLVGSPPIFLRIGIGNYARTPSTLIVAPTMISHTIVGLNTWFVPWENSYNLLEIYM